MGFSTGKYAKIWEITPGDRSTKVRISTSKKVNDKYEQDFSGFVTLSGTAHQEASNLKVGDTFRIGECSVTTRYDKEKKKEEDEAAELERKKAEVALNQENAKIVELCTSKKENGVDPNKMYAIIEKYTGGKKNPNAIKSIEDSQACYKEIEAMKA